MESELISKYDTIGHRILDLEAELGVSTEPHKETLDGLIEEAKRTIQVKDTYTREDAIGILRTIDNILQNNEFKQRREEENIDELPFLYEGIGSKKINCFNTSIFYLSVADALNLPIVAVSAPRHLFVRFILNEEEINWETTTAREVGNEVYIRRLNISDESISKGVYLKNLTRQETISIIYNTRGNAWSNIGKFDKAIADYNSAIELNPNLAECYHNMGSLWYDKGKYVKSIENYDKAIELNPNYARAYFSRGNTWFMKRELGKAIADYDEAIRLSRNQTLAYKYRGVAKLLNYNFLGAGADFVRAKIPIFR